MWNYGVKAVQFVTNVRQLYMGMDKYNSPSILHLMREYQ